MRQIAIGVILFLLVTSAWAGKLRDDFSDGNFDGWEPISFRKAKAEWSVKDDKLIITSPTDWAIGLTIGEDSWQDYSIEFDATFDAKLQAFSLLSLGLHFQGNDQQWHHVWMSYGFRPAKATGAHVIVSKRPGGWIQDVTRRMPFEIGKTYHLKGTVSGGSYQFYIDDELALQIVEDRFPSGKAGLYVVGATASIDNVVIEGDDVPDTYLDVVLEGKLPTTWAILKSKP